MPNASRPHCVVPALPRKSAPRWKRAALPPWSRSCAHLAELVSLAREAYQPLSVIPASTSLEGLVVALDNLARTGQPQVDAAWRPRPGPQG